MLSPVGSNSTYRYVMYGSPFWNRLVADGWITDSVTLKIARMRKVKKAKLQVSA